mmetsp:Transcript_33612/g.32088  ORF Transcript_33612/g.32088 Transcript_33612/m.32088 type:complete len:485 (+) Transcript_33612:147-1601(+)
MTDNASQQPLFTFPQCTAHLKSECEILSKLIYRNNNQHRSTKVFCSLKKASKIMQLIPSEELESLNSQAEKNLRLMQNPKVNTRDLTASIRCAQQLYKAISIGIEAAMWFNRSARLLHLQLSQLLFVPLYTIFLALTARSLNSLSILIFQFDLQFFSLKSQIQHIAAVNPRHIPLVQSILPSLIFNKSTLDFIDELLKVYTPQDKNNSQKSINILSDNRTVNSNFNQHGNTINSSKVGTSSSLTVNSNMLESGKLDNYTDIESEEMTTIVPVNIAPIESFNPLESIIENTVKSEFDSNSEVVDSNTAHIDEDFGEIIGSSIPSFSSIKLKSKNKKNKKKKNDGKNKDASSKDVEMYDDDTPSMDIVSTNQDKDVNVLGKVTATSLSGIQKNQNGLNDLGILNDTESITASSGSDINNKSNTNDDEFNGIINFHNNNDIVTKLDEKILPRKKKNKSIGTLVNNEMKAKKRKKMENDDIDDIFGEM